MKIKIKNIGSLKEAEYELGDFNITGALIIELDNIKIENINYVLYEAGVKFLSNSSRRVIFAGQ